VRAFSTFFVDRLSISAGYLTDWPLVVLAWRIACCVRADICACKILFAFR
jgi:hypothetical protein